MLSDLRLSALLDSGSTHCFIDADFVALYELPTISVNPIELKLFDGTSNFVINQSVNFPVLFPTGESMTFNFYVTPLDHRSRIQLAHPLQSID